MSAALALLSALALSPSADGQTPPEASDTTASERVEEESGEETSEVRDVSAEIIEGRRRPGYEAQLPDRQTQDNPGALRAPPPEAFPTDQIPIPDRWRLIETLGIVKERWFDPYNQNTLKGDRPLDPDKWPLITGHDWFFSASAISDTVIEPRTFPIPVGVQTTERPGSLDILGKDASYELSQTIIAGGARTKG